MRLVVNDDLEGFVDVRSGRFDLRQRGVVLAKGRHDGGVFARLEIEVNGLVREAGELVAKAKYVFT